MAISHPLLRLPLVVATKHLDSGKQNNLTTPTLVIKAAITTEAASKVEAVRTLHTVVSTTTKVKMTILWVEVMLRKVTVAVTFFLTKLVIPINIVHQEVIRWSG